MIESGTLLRRSFGCAGAGVDLRYPAEWASLVDALPLPAAGTRSLELVGNLTVKGVTRPTTWRVQATFAGDTVSGTAATAFTFGDFELAQPRVPVVLSVADTIRLEYDFRMAARE